MKLMINIIFSNKRRDIPRILKYCESCRKYKPIELYEKGMKICDKCKNKVKKNDIKNLKIINNVVSEYFNLTLDEIKLNTRERKIVKARQIAMYFGKEKTFASDRIIGENLGNKDRTTVLATIKTVSDLIDTNSVYRNDINEIRKLIQSKIKSS